MNDGKTSRRSGRRSAAREWKELALELDRYLFERDRRWTEVERLSLPPAVSVPKVRRIGD